MKSHCKPKPSHSWIAIINRSWSLCSDSYSGKMRVLKHVCEVGSWLLSGPARWITKLSLPNPPIGARMLPVANMSSFRCMSNERLCTIFQNAWIVGWSAEKPPTYFVTCCRAWKSSWGVPEMSNSTSCDLFFLKKKLSFVLVLLSLHNKQWI